MSQIKKLRPLVQLLPAAAVAAAVLFAVPNTRPVLAAVPERLAPAEQPASEAAEPEQPEEEALPKLPYADGVYTGSSRGYGGPVKVQVTMEGGYITDVQILDASHETSAFLKRAKRLLGIVTESQTWEVDAVSEATYTSRGILGAIQNALTGEEVINPAPPKQQQPEPLVVEEFTTPSAYRDGVYTASAQGFGGPITLQVTIADDTITDITVVSAEGETRSYFSRARHVISAILESGTPDVDAVSGATYSSTGILNAVKSALKKAAVDADPADETTDLPEETAPEETAPAEEPTPQYADGVYTGSSEGVVVSVTVADGQVTEITVVDDGTEPPSFLEKVRAALRALLTDKTADETPAYTEQQLADAVQAALQQAAGTPAQTPAQTEEPAASAPAPEESTPASAAESSAESTAQQPASEAASAPAAAPQYRDGSYTATAVCTDGDEFCYDVRVTVTVAGGVVTDVQITRENDTSENPADNRRYLDRARDGRTDLSVPEPGLVSQILQKQSTDGVDLVSGATYSSRAALSAAAQALAQGK